MRNMLLVLLGIMLVLTACVSNKSYKVQKEQVQILEQRQNSQDALLEMARKDINDNRKEIDDIVIRLNGAEGKMKSLDTMQAQIDASAANITAIQNELTAVNARLEDAIAKYNSLDKRLADINTNLGQKITDLNSDTNDTFDAYTDYLKKMKDASANYATKDELQSLVDESNQLTATLADLTSQVEVINGYISSEEEDNSAEEQNTQQMITDIKSRITNTEIELATIMQDIAGMDQLKEEIETLNKAETDTKVDVNDLRTRLTTVNNDLTTLTTDLQQVIIKERAAAEERRIKLMKKQYAAALAEYNNGKFENSILLFEEFDKAYPECDLSPNSMYWIGENYYSAGNLPKALRQFQNVVSKYPGTDKAWDAQLKVGMTYYRLDDKKSAYDELMIIKNQNPKYAGMKIVDKYLRKVQP